MGNKSGKGKKSKGGAVKAKNDAASADTGNDKGPAMKLLLIGDSGVGKV